MAETTLTVTTGAGVLAAGDAWVSSGWTTFDHAALVTACRSRADGYDLRVRSVVTGAQCTLLKIVGANTAACVVYFTAAEAQAAFTPNANYRLAFGNLGAQTSPYTNQGGSYVATGTGALTIPAVTLPPPGFVVELEQGREAVTLEYPDFLTSRRAALHENPRLSWRLNWSNILPEDYYEIRAFVRAQFGGAGTFSNPSWLTAGTWRVVPNSYSGDQYSRLGFRSTLMVETCIA